MAPLGPRRDGSGFATDFRGILVKGAEALVQGFEGHSARR